MQVGRPVILVVEDEPATRELLWQVLESYGYAVETAADGTAALTRLAQGGIDIVLLDQMLPHIHGLQLCRELRAAHSGVYLPLIMLTALTGEPYRLAAAHAGVDVYLTKPVDLDELLHVLGRWAQTCERLRDQPGWPAPPTRPAGAAEPSSSVGSTCGRWRLGTVDLHRPGASARPSEVSG